MVFGRGDRGHVVINAGELPIDVSVETDLPAGEYCNVVSSGSSSDCAGAPVVVSDDRRLQAQLDPMTALAILRPL